MVCSRGALSTSVVVAGTTVGRIANDAVTMIRMIHPQTANPVAVAAGLCFSTVSVNPAIHET